MKIIVPMAGRGTRLRPHTLTVPKPLIKIVGKPIVQRLVEDLTAMCEEPVEEIAFIIGDFGAEVEKELLCIAESLGAKGTIYHQDKPLGTAHAVLCAAPSLSGNVIVAFADTLFKADFQIETNHDSVIWVQKVENPSAYGVVKLNDAHQIVDFVEKPQSFVSDLAIIGIYYFRDGQHLKDELQYLIDHNVTVKGEYQLTDALQNMKNKGLKFVPGTVQEWLDCGNKDTTVATNARYMEYLSGQPLISEKCQVTNSVIIPPVYIGDGAVVKDSVIGPHVSIGLGTQVSRSVIQNALIQDHSHIEQANIAHSMIGSHVRYTGRAHDLSVGDYNVVIA